MSDEWMSPQLRQATAQFNAAVQEATQASREASATARTLAANAGDITATPAYQRLERQAAAHFRAGRSGPAARHLQERVDRGEVTWRQIWSGEADPETTKLYRENQSAILSGIDEARRLDTTPANEPPNEDDPDDDGPIFRGFRRQ
jgi:hypothetical protein